MGDLLYVRRSRLTVRSGRMLDSLSHAGINRRPANLFTLLEIDNTCPAPIVRIRRTLKIMGGPFPYSILLPDCSEFSGLASQFSTRKPATRENSSTLAVTMMHSMAKA